MTENMPSGPRWLRASRSLSKGACIELAATGSGIAIRDSKNPSGAVLSFTRQEFEAFLDGAKKGEFDHLV